ncbi:MAG: MnhB domain-containing protein [Oscillospiraceae bacterium]|nr:MnhB domain-containing protein [Oscillospiraceae bacterium]
MNKINSASHTLWGRLSAWVEGDPLPREKKAAAPAPSAPREKKPPVKKMRRFIAFYRVMAVVFCVVIIGVLMATVNALPLFGRADNPASNEVVQRYVESGLEETGAVNIVAGMILDYRAFDTFGESSVLFLAVTSVMILLLRDKNNTDREEDLRTARELIVENKSEDVILQRIAVILVPCILLYGIYVILNGHLSPGGGFSGGAIAGAGLILYASSFGMIRLHRFFSQKTFTAVTTSCLLVYACSKGYSFFTGANHLPTGIPLGTPGAILSSGLILPLDICVGLIVTCTMYGFYAMFTKGEI